MGQSKLKCCKNELACPLHRSEQEQWLVQGSTQGYKDELHESVRVSGCLGFMLSHEVQGLQ